MNMFLPTEVFNNNHMTKNNNNLYYYCKLSTALESILSDYKLLLNPISKTNDPRETKSFVFEVLNESGIDIEKFNEKVSKIMRDDCKVLCFSQDHNNNHAGYKSSRMWAYYGDNHKGLCLLLDKKEFLEENKKVIDPDLLRKINYYKFDFEKQHKDDKQVNYISMKKMGEGKYLRDVFRPQHLDYLYFTKNEEWESEHEIRQIYFSNNKEKQYCSITNSLKEIYVGVDFHNSYLPAIIKLCSHVNILKMEYKNVTLIPKVIYESK